jgi:SAM-dependent methyltransferase
MTPGYQYDPRRTTRVLDATRQSYARSWNHTSAAYAEQGLYNWMASFITGFTRVLEIGTGTGRGTAAMAAAGHAVIGVEENPALVYETVNRLAAVSVPWMVATGRSEAVPLIGAPPGLEWAHGIAYAPLPPLREPLPGEAVVIEGNVLSCADPELVEGLGRIPPRDAVVCWLIGTHSGVHLNAALGFRDTEPPLYRLRVQNAVYTLAERILRPGGALHVVDRAPAADDVTAAELLEGHREQASATPSLVIEPPEFHPYQLDESDEHVQLQRVDGTPVTSGYLCSIIARKAA